MSKKPTVLCFVQTGCPACHEFMPRLERVSKHHRGRGARVMTGDIARTPQAQVMADRFKIEATPTTIVIGPKGGMQRLEGAVSDTELENALRASWYA